MHSLRIKATGVVAGLALCLSPTMAAAATAPVQTLNPLVAVGVFGSAASAQAACGAATSTAAAAGAATMAQVQTGCVLPVTDAPPPVVDAGPAVPPPPRASFGILPVLLGLIGIAVLAALIAKGDGGDEPSSPA